MCKRRPNSEPSKKLLKEEDTPGQAENSRGVERRKSKKARDDLVGTHMLRYRGSMYMPFHVELPPPYLPAHCTFRRTQKRLRRGLAAEIPSPRVLFFAESDQAIYQDGVDNHESGRRKKMSARSNSTRMKRKVSISL